LHAPSIPNLPIAQTRPVTDGAFAMQAASCGHRLGISGQFRETFATNVARSVPHVPRSFDVVRRKGIAANDASVCVNIGERRRNLSGYSPAGPQKLLD
jgi:hypothetical protein